MLEGIPLSYRIYFFIVLSASGFSIICHSVGLFSIYLHKKKTNQNMILTFLCLADTTSSIHRILSECFLVATMAHKVDPQIVVPVLRGLFYTKIYVMILAYFILTLDRLVCCINPLMYKVRMTRRRIQAMFVFSLVFSITVGVTTGIINSFRIRQWINLIGFVLGGIGVITAIVTYYKIIKKLRWSRKQYQQSLSNPGAWLKKEFMIPTVLIAMYITLYIIPSLIINFYPWPWKGEDEFKLRLVSTGYCVCLVIPEIGAIADAFTFTLLAKHYRKSIMNLFRKTRYVSNTHRMAVLSYSGLRHI